MKVRKYTKPNMVVELVFNNIKFKYLRYCHGMRHRRKVIASIQFAF